VGELGPRVPGVLVVEEEFRGVADTVGSVAVCDQSVDLAEAGSEDVPSLGATFSLVDAWGTHACLLGWNQASGDTERRERRK
jgi:hypothetical protein